MTIFPCLADTRQFLEAGYSGMYVPPHTDTFFYDCVHVEDAVPEIVFIGNNFGDRFQEGGIRSEMVTRLQFVFGPRFGVYGYGWNGAMPVPPSRERMLYSNTKIAINHNHINESGYTSDRMMRAMSCGAAVITSAIDNGIPHLKCGIDYLEWHDVDELIDIIHGLLENDDLRMRISSNGRDAVRTNYSWDRFVEKIIAMCELH